MLWSHVCTRRQNNRIAPHPVTSETLHGLSYPAASDLEWMVGQSEPAFMQQHFFLKRCQPLGISILLFGSGSSTQPSVESSEHSNVLLNKAPISPKTFSCRRQRPHSFVTAENQLFGWQTDFSFFFPNKKTWN